MAGIAGRGAGAGGPWRGMALLAALALSAPPAGAADHPARTASPAARLTQTEKLTLVRAEVVATPVAGVSLVTLPGVPRAGLPALRMALLEAGAGQRSPLALMATWDRDLARR
ncbi:hypothetical protein HLH26_05235, partial [Gluconacetobacter sp. 1b LMG 1731]|nr:hypothetical protein [Gluconacetobacter dulcium]